MARQETATVISLRIELSADSLRDCAASVNEIVELALSTERQAQRA